MLPPALLFAPLAQNKVRLLLSVVSIALGVALGFAVQLVNRAAISEFSQAVQTLSGEADVTVRGPRAGFDEALYPLLARQSDVAAASPALEIDGRIAGRDDSLKILGLDVLRAAAVQPALVPQADETLDLLREDAIFLTPSAANDLTLKIGDTLAFQVGLDRVAFRVAGLINGAGAGRRLAVIDIAAAQWRFNRAGLLNRLDLRLSAGVPPEHAIERIRTLLPAGVYAESPKTAADSAASLTRAYRMNLNVLALVALFTGALLVFSAQALAVVQRRAQLALLRVLGVTRHGVVFLLLAEAAIIGLAGSAIGLALGVGGARLILDAVGPDLGAGLFRGLRPELAFEPAAALLFLALGVGAALLGSLLPALEAGRARPAQALKAGDDARVAASLTAVTPGIVLLTIGAALALLPPVGGLPLFGYVSIASLLFGTLALMPRLVVEVLRRAPIPQRAELALGISQLRGTPGQAMVSLAAIVAAVSLAASVAIMVNSFRTSLELWLEHILPADLFVRTSGYGDTAYLSADAQSRLARIPGTRAVEFLAGQQIQIDPGKPRVTLLARSMDAHAPGKTLMLMSRFIVPQANDPPPVWVSEIIADTYRYEIGDVIELPVSGRNVALTVSGIWRDYARMQGAMMLDLALYRRLTGESNVADAGLWLEPGADRAEVKRAIREVLPETDLEITEPEELRTLSLAIFDRTFAVTYALEAIAIVIGLAGLSASFGALTLARKREFGMLRHIGLTRMQIRRMIAFEGLLTSAIGLAVGLVLGWLMSLVLIHVVNRQSFHWSMELYMPWLGLAGFASVMLLAATLTATASARRAMADDAVRAVKEDW